MGLIADRVKLIIARSGEALSFTKLNGSTAGAPFSVKGLCSELDGGTRSVFFNSVELMGIDYPALCVRFAGDCNLAVADTFTRGGITWTCLKYSLEYVNGEGIIVLGMFHVA